jgi:adenosylcobinamide kinase/adenosylcobinamide-phosphate guanylyltransferase
MAKLIFITGGQRSGKSRYAQEMALSMSDCPIYLATSRIWDDDHGKRIKRHQDDRDDRWTTIEEQTHLNQHLFTNKVVVLDCITLWLTNLFYDNKSDVDKSLTEAKEIFSSLIEQDFTLIVISNEIGMGGHASNELQLKFTDLQGWMNQYIASLADEVVLMVSGLVLRVK